VSLERDQFQLPSAAWEFFRVCSGLKADALFTSQFDQFC
jgi:hypothetical protein